MSHKVSYVCSACGVTSDEKRVYFRSKYGSPLCAKHYEQMRLHGKILDHSPYSVYEKNRYTVVDDTVIMVITDKRQNPIFETLYDVKFLSDISKRKWRITYKRGHPYVVTIALPEEETKHITLHRYIAKLSGMNIDGFEIDHINGNTLDNRLCNLRLATRHEQVSNIAPRKQNKYGIRGISFDNKYHKYVIDFGIDGIRYYCKPVKTLEEAVYTRYAFEKCFFDDVAISRHLPAMQPYIDRLTHDQKNAIDDYVLGIIRRKERDAS